MKVGHAIKLPAVLGGRNNGNILTDFVQDLRHGLRVLAKNAGFTVAAIITLALGIGSSTTVFTMVNTLLLHPLPVNERLRTWSPCIRRAERVRSNPAAYYPLHISI